MPYNFAADSFRTKKLCSFYINYLSVCLCGAINRIQPTYLSVFLSYILYACNQTTSFDGVVPSGSLLLYF